MSPTSVVAYLLLFALAGVAFVFAALAMGWLLRPKAPVPEKLETYECGEPTVGSSYLQFDLRFYVVALVFIIFDVEVAFFFPWAAVFGKTTQLLAPSLAQAVRVDAPGGRSAVVPSGPVSQTLGELGVRTAVVPDPGMGVEANSRRMTAATRHLARAAMADMAVFFAVLMVGFAYVWSRRDLDWVRAIGRRPAEEPDCVGASGGAAGSREG